MLSEEDAKSLRIAFNAIEQERWDRAGSLAINQLGHGADLQVPVSAVDALKLAHRFNEIEPLPHVFISPRQISFIDSVRLFFNRHKFPSIAHGSAHSGFNLRRSTQVECIRPAEFMAPLVL